jgi:hypothetical protein
MVYAAMLYFFPNISLP